MYKVTKEQKLVIKFICFASKIIYIKKRQIYYIIFFKGLFDIFVIIIVISTLNF